MKFTCYKPTKVLCISSRPQRKNYVLEIHSRELLTNSESNRIRSSISVMQLAALCAVCHKLPLGLTSPLCRARNEACSPNCDVSQVCIFRKTIFLQLKKYGTSCILWHGSFLCFLKGAVFMHRSCISVRGVQKETAWILNLLAFLIFLSFFLFYFYINYSIW